MAKPLCPLCQEDMSLAEFGLQGVWSCIYCEGTWLSTAELVRHARDTGRSATALQWLALPEEQAGLAPRLHCPACNTHTFLAVACGNTHTYFCRSCHGLYFENGAITRLAPHLDARKGLASVPGDGTGGGVLGDVVVSIALGIVTGLFP